VRSRHRSSRTPDDVSRHQSSGRAAPQPAAGRVLSIGHRSSGRRRRRLRTCPTPPARDASLLGRVPALVSRSVGVTPSHRQLLRWAPARRAPPWPGSAWADSASASQRVRCRQVALISRKPHSATPHRQRWRHADLSAATTRKRERGPNEHCCSLAWIGAVSASLLPCDGCRSGTGSDRVPAEARGSSIPPARSLSARVPSDCSIRRGADVSTCAPAARLGRAPAERRLSEQCTAV
jgi:hypothetical protein